MDVSFVFFLVDCQFRSKEEALVHELHVSMREPSHQRGERDPSCDVRENKQTSLERCAQEAIVLCRSGRARSFTDSRNVPMVILLSAWFEGRIVARVQQGLLSEVQPDPTGTPFDRLELYRRPAGTRDRGERFVIDILPIRDLPDPNNFLVVERDPVDSRVRAVEFRGRIRCHVAGRMAPFLTIAGTLRPTGDWLQFESLSFGDGTASGPMPIEALAGATATLGSEFPSAFLDALGLAVKATGGAAMARFVEAPRPAPADAPFQDPAAGTGPITHVLRFTRRIALRRSNQRLSADPVLICLDAGIVVLHGLDGCQDDPAPIELTQTGLVFVDYRSDQLTPAAGGVVVSIAGLPSVPLLAAWNHAAVQPYLGSLQTVQDGRPISVLPEFLLPGRAPASPCDPVCATGTAPGAAVTCGTHPPPPLGDDLRWVVTFDVADGVPGDQQLSPEDFAPGGRGLVRFRAATPLPVSKDPFYRVVARFPALLRHDLDLQPLVLRFAVLRAVEANTSTDQNAAARTQGRLESVWRGFVYLARQLFPVAPNDAGAPRPDEQPPQRVRIGALDLEFDPRLADTSLDLFVPDGWDESVPDRQSLLQVGFRRPRRLDVCDLPETEARLLLRVNRLGPGGQDGLPDEPFHASEDPLQQLNTPANSPAARALRFRREPPITIPLQLPMGGRFTLVGREQSAAAQSQLLALRLFERRGDPRPPSAPGRGVGERFGLIIVDRQPLLIARVQAPPLRGLAGADGNREVGNWSAAGTEGASWELAGATDGFRLAFPPQTIGEGTEKRRDQDVVEGQAAGFRLGPPARFRVKSSYFRQNFTEAVWNLRRILGYPGQRAPGTAAPEMAFELLYGLGCEVRVPGLRLAELAARLGAIPLDLPDVLSRPFGTEVEQVPGLTDAYERYHDRWADAFVAYHTRLGVFEPWSEARSGTLSLSYEDGVRYTVRDPAGLTRNPADRTGGDPRLLPGGALWGLEFRAQFDAFLDPAGRKATGGELSRPAFSALGGWGYQKAVFRGGLTTIYSDTAMGRVFFYSVEQKGRIAGFWNQAKHVVIYERTVAPAHQFREEQDHLAGRPVLRKVAEFVELLQPVRSYPDFDAAPVTRGCVLAIEFRSKVIPVTSAWGRDVPGQGTFPAGYVIPLWRPGADPTDYPKPQIAVRIAGATAAGEDLPCELDEPQKLLFYAAPAAPTADTDQWPAIVDVDHPDQDWPMPPEPRPDPAVDLDAPQPDEQPIEPGYHAFTHAIIATRPADIVATRAKQSLGVLLRNVTMVRSDPAQPPPDNVEASKQVSAGRGQLAAATRALNDLIALVPAGGDAQKAAAQIQQAAKAVADTAMQGAQSYVAGFGQLPSNPLATPRKWVDLTRNALTGWEKSATDTLTREFMDRLPRDIRLLPGSAAEVKQGARALMTERLELFKLLVPPLDPGARQLTDLLHKAEAVQQRVGAALAAEVAAARQRLERLLAAGADVANLGAAAVEAARRLEAAAREPLGQARDEVARFFDELPTIAGTAVVGIVQAIRTRSAALQTAIATGGDVAGRVKELEQLVAEAELQTGSFVAKARQARTDLENRAALLLTLDLGGGFTLQPLVTGLEQRLDDATQLGNDAAGVAKEVERAIAEEIGRVKSDIKRALDAGGELQKFANDTLAKAAGLLGKIDPDQLKTKFFGDPPQWQDKIDAALQNLATPDAARRALAALAEQARGELDNLAARVAGPVVAAFPTGLTQAGGKVLRLVRAFGDAPRVAGMGFSREQLGYFYNPLKAGADALPVDITPVNALVNRVGDHLKAAGMRLPTGQLLDQVLPPKDELLRDFDLGKLLPDFAGLKLDKLLPDLRAPDNLKDKVKISQQFDRQAGRGWVQADVRISEVGPTTLFDAGPIRIEVANILLTATMRIEAGLGAGPQRTQSGRLAADWDLTVGGQKFITFADTALTFDQSGKTKFDLDPRKVRLNGVLQMLSDAFAAVSNPDDGFTLRLKDEGGLPVGVEAILAIPLPDCSFGPCGLSNLRFGAVFELVARPEFALGVRAYVSEKMAPFTLVIFILGGGGWVDVRARYLPLSGRITTALSIGVSAGAMLAIAFGPVKGSVFAFFFVEAELMTDSAAPGTQLTIRVGLLLGGEVDVLGLITVSIKLLLELEYRSADGKLVGRGTLSIKVKICWFLTIKVSMTVEKEFAKVGGGSGANASPGLTAAAPRALPPDPIAQAVEAYLTLVE